MFDVEILMFRERNYVPNACNYYQKYEIISRVIEKAPVFRLFKSAKL